MDIFDRKLLIRRRARAAASASAHDFLLLRATDEIASRLDGISRSFPVAADIGAHHGILARALRDKQFIETIVSVESCAALARLGGGLVAVADEETPPFAPESLNLVVSALALQFVNDLPGALVQIRRALKPDGLLLASLMGGETLRELRQCFADAELEMEGGVSPRVAPMADVRDCGALLQRAGFALPVADSDRFTVTYPDAFALMRDLRGMGATSVMLARRRTPLRRATLFRMAQLYHERFSVAGGRIAATFEIVTITGWAPHESQQKPLQPGSAKTRLADALGVPEQKLWGC